MITLTFSSRSSVSTRRNLGLGKEPTGRFLAYWWCWVGGRAAVLLGFWALVWSGVALVLTPASASPVWRGVLPWLAAVLTTLATMRRYFVAPQTEPEPRCAVCGYCTRGVVSGRCPECGAAMPDDGSGADA